MEAASARKVVELEEIMTFRARPSWSTVTASVFMPRSDATKSAPEPHIDERRRKKKKKENEEKENEENEKIRIKEEEGKKRRKRKIRKKRE